MEIVRRTIAAFVENNYERLIELSDPRIEYDVSRTNPESRVARGHEEVLLLDERNPRLSRLADRLLLVTERAEGDEIKRFRPAAGAEVMKVSALQPSAGSIPGDPYLLIELPFLRTLVQAPPAGAPERRKPGSSRVCGGSPMCTPFMAPRSRFRHETGGSRPGKTTLFSTRFGSVCGFVAGRFCEARWTTVWRPAGIKRPAQGRSSYAERRLRPAGLRRPCRGRRLRFRAPLRPHLRSR